MRQSDIPDSVLPPGTKGLPLDGSVKYLHDLPGRGLNLLRGDLPVPVALVKRSALDNNLPVMQAYVERAGVRLAPHAKTTMCPQLFARQLDGGAWGLTVATMTQFKLCHDLGVKRLILANQLVGRAEIAALARMSAAAPQHTCYALVDSLAGAQAISEGFGEVPDAPPARVLIELGMVDGRCGVRTVDEGRDLALAIRGLPNIELHGVEGFEGLVVREAAAVSGYLSDLLRLYETLSAEGLFADPGQVIFSAGGSAYYDLVAHLVTRRPRGLVPVLRSGCYLTHDSGFYRRLLADMQDRALEGPPPALKPALEVWTRVISRPQPDQAIVLMGKRDVSFDIDLPMARLWYREGAHPAPRPIDGIVVDKLNDQHGILRISAGLDLAVGDLLGFDISHPCTTFDKWSLLLEVDDDYTVSGGLKTFF